MPMNVENRKTLLQNPQSTPGNYIIGVVAAK